MLAQVGAPVRIHDKTFTDAGMVVADITSANTILPCGNACVPLGGDVYCVKMGIGKSIGKVHTKEQCSLYVPSYQFSPKAKSLYLSNKQHTINYIDLDFTRLMLK